MSTHSAGAVGSACRCSVTLPCLPWDQCKSRLCAVTICFANRSPLKGGAVEMGRLSSLPDYFLQRV